MKALLLAAAVIAAPMTASAVTVAAGDYVTINGGVSPGGSLTYSYDVTSPVMIDFVALSASGATTSDLSNLSFSVNGTSYALSSISQQSFPTGSVASGSGFASGFLATGTFDIVVSLAAAASKSVSYTFTFTSSDPAPVPLPAAGALLAAALAAAGGAAALRRKKEQA